MVGQEGFPAGEFADHDCQQHGDQRPARNRQYRPVGAHQPLDLGVIEHHEGRDRRDHQYPRYRRVAKRGLRDQRQHDRSGQHHEIIPDQTRRLGQAVKIDAIEIDKGYAGKQRENGQRKHKLQLFTHDSRSSRRHRASARMSRRPPRARSKRVLTIRSRTRLASSDRRCPGGSSA